MCSAKFADYDHFLLICIQCLLLPLLFFDACPDEIHFYYSLYINIFLTLLFGAVVFTTTYDLNG